MSYSSRFFLYAPLVLFLALAGTVGVYWWVAASALSKKLDALNGHEAMPGVSLSFRSKTVSGFPFNLDVLFSDFRLTVQTPHGPTSWRTENFALHALTYGREQMLFEAAGQQLLDWHDMQQHSHRLGFAVGELHASAIENQDGLSHFDLICVGFGSAALTAARIQLHARLNPNGRVIDIAIGSDALRLSPRLTGLFGKTINQLHMEATLSPSSPFNGLRQAKTSWVKALEAWRKNSGFLSVSDFEIAFDRLAAVGHGSLSLDEANFVEGQMSLQITGMETLVDLANHQGIHGANPSGLAAALLDRASRKGSNGAGTMNTVISFHAGSMGVGDTVADQFEPLY